jgi:hypothetical protein
MNTSKMTALLLSVMVIPGFLSACSRTHVRTEERPYGQSYVKESPEEKVKTYTEEVKKNASGEVERLKEKHIKESGEKTSHDLNPYNRPKNEAYSKEEIHKEQKTEHGRT